MFPPPTVPPAVSLLPSLPFPPSSLDLLPHPRRDVGRVAFGEACNDDEGDERDVDDGGNQVEPTALLGTVLPR